MSSITAAGLPPRSTISGLFLLLFAFNTALLTDGHFIVRMISSQPTRRRTAILCGWRSGMGLPKPSRTPAR
jgi:hypothetical protein